MISSDYIHELAALLNRPLNRIWRHVFIVMALVATALSQSFFVFGNITAVPTYAIYGFGFAFALTALSIVYINLYFLAPKFLTKKDYATYLMLLVLLVTLMVGVKSIGEFALFSHVGLSKKWNGITVLDGLSNSILYTVCIASTTTPFMLRQLAADSEKIDNLENTKLKNSIDEIKNRVRPQFLSTTLAAAAEKVKTSPEETSATLLMLSKWLRYQLYDSTRDKVLLSAEITFIRHYLMIYRQNSEKNFTFNIQITGNINKFISPGLFTLCIEEVCGLNPGEIQLNIHVTNECIQLDCEASGLREDSFATEQKIKLIYGNKTTIMATSDTLKIQLNTC